MNGALINHTPPQNVRAEKAVLGSIILDDSTLSVALEYLKPSDFYHRANQYIFAGMVSLNNHNQKIDSITLSNYLMSKKRLQDVGGMRYLANLVTTTPTASNVKYYAKIVRDKSLTRRLIKTAQRIAQAGYTNTGDVDTLLNKAESQITNVAQQQSQTNLRPANQITAQSFLDENRLAQDNRVVTGLPTGFPDIDKLTTGLHGGEFVVIAARPGMGKTTIAANIAEQVAEKTSDSVAFFSLEMGAESIINRMICAKGGIDANHLRTGNMNNSEWQKLVFATGNISRDNIYVDDTPGANIASILARSRRLAKQTHNLRLIIVDYLQLIEGNTKENRQQEVSEVSRQLKKLAKELNVPVIALSQLSRNVEQREDKRPVLSDIRESGSIEQDADIVAFLYRKDYYERKEDDDDDKSGASQREHDQSDTEFIIEKNRSGPQGTVHLMFIKPWNKFTPINDKSAKSKEE